MSNSAPGDPVEAECPGCGRPVTAGPDEQRTLHEAVAAGDLEGADLLIEEGAAVDATDKEARTPPHRAAEWNRPRMAKALLEAGADPNTTTNAGKPPLYWAARWGYAAVVEHLLKAGADVDAPVGGRRTPLHWATKKNHAKIADLLLEAEADPNIQADEGEAPLHRVAKRGLLEMAGRLLEAGADPDVRDRKGRAPLFVAIREKHTDIANLLVRRGASPETIVAGGFTRPVPQFSNDDLQWAAKEGHLQVVDFLLEAGAEVNRTNEHGWTPLHRARYWEHPDVVVFLLQNGADPSKTDYCGRSPLHEPSPEVLEAIVKSVGNGSGLLETLLACREPDVRSRVAAHPNAPGDFINLMRRAGSRLDLRGLSVEDPDPITAKERERLQEAGPFGRKLLAAHPDTPPDEVVELAAEWPGAVVQNPSLKIFAMEDPGWTEALSLRAWEALCAEEEAPGWLLRQGARHGSSFVRSTVARHEATPTETLANLTDDGSLHVRRVAEQNLSSEE